METKFDFDDYFPFREYRNYQRETISEIIDIFERGKRFVVLEAPTGIGKSAIAYTVGKSCLGTMSREVIEEHKKFRGPPILICTKTRQLQKQYMDSFDNLENIWSSRHYFCALEPTYREYFYKSPLCEKHECRKHSECEFLRAKQRFMHSDIGILNYHYYIYSLFSDVFSPKLLVLDEAHNVENILCDIFTLVINKKRLLKFFDAAVNRAFISRSSTKRIEKILDNVIQSKAIDDNLTLNLNNLLTEVQTVNTLGKRAIEILKIMSKRDESDEIPFKKRAIEISHSITTSEDLIDKISRFINGDAEWMISEQNENKIKFKPLEIGHLSGLLFRSAKRFLFMSATICGVNQFCKDLNLNGNECGFISTKSVIPVENRKVFSFNTGTINYKNKEDVFPKIISKMDNMIHSLEESKGAELRGIIHSVSYKNAETIRDLSKYKDRMIIPVGSEVMDIDELLRTYDNTIVVSPSIMEGVDLKDDLSRFQIFPKVPFLFLGDKWVREKMNRDNVWYVRKAIMNIIQGSGRSIRTEEDWSVTMIFDSSFRRLLSQYKQIFSGWYMEAIKIVTPVTTG